VLLLIDGIPALQPDAGFPSWNDIALENIAQVEVVKGASSALYGSSALNGVINVRYAQPGSEPETKASINYTTFGAPKDIRSQWWDSSPYAFGASVLRKQKIKKYDLVAGLQYYQLESFRQETHQRRGRIILNNRYRLTDRTTIGLNVIGNLSDNASFIFWENALRGSYKPFAGTEVNSFNNRWILDPYVTHYDKAGNKHRFQGRLFYTDNGAANGLDNFSLLRYGEYQFQRKIANLDLVFTTGITGTATNIDAGLYGGAKYFSSNAGAYFQVDKAVGDRLKLSFGGRYEYNSLRNSDIVVEDGDFSEFVDADFVQEGKPVFRFGANYRVGKATFLRTSIGQGYRFPTIAEKFTTVGLASFRIFTNADLQSETGWSSEIAVKQGLKLGELYAFLDIAGFWSEYNSMMEFLLTGKNGVFGFQSSNIGDTRIRGLDTNLTGKFGTKKLPITFIIGYTYLDPRYQDFNDNVASSSSVDFNVLKYRSLHNAKADIEASAFGFSLGVNGRYVSHMLAIDEEFNLFIPGLRNFRDVNDSGYFLLNLRAAYKYKDYKLSLLVNNVMNTAYTVRPALLEAPRNISVRLDAKF
jgi:iron complex outermembrane receptor protein